MKNDLQVGIEGEQLRITGTATVEQAEQILQAAMVMVRDHKKQQEKPPKRPPLPIPDDFDVEKEKKRAQQGGCCGGGSK